MPPDLRERIEDAAAKNNRSLNAEILQRLETTLEMDAYQPGENVTPDDNVIHIPEELAEKIRIAAESMKRSPENQALATLEAAYLPLRGNSRI